MAYEQEVQQALTEVAQAMNRLTEAFQNHVASLRVSGTDEYTLMRVDQAARAITDSVAIFMTWAQYFASDDFKNASNTPDTA